MTARVSIVNKMVGRKKLPADKKSKQHGFQLYKEEFDLIMKNAKEMGFDSFGSFMRTVAKEWLLKNDFEGVQEKIIGAHWNKKGEY